MASPQLRLRFSHWFLLLGGSLMGVTSAAAANSAAENFHREIKPLLTKYCFDCHGDGKAKGQVSFDEFASDAEMLAKTKLWNMALKNVRAGMMPPPDDADAAKPTPEEIQKLEKWIKTDVFAIDPANPDPGRVTVRRLNRIEYRNTIRDLMGIDFNAEAEFPPDDSGHGFDNMGEVLSISTLHLEKYLTAAETIVDRAVPKVGRVMREITATGRDFRAEGEPAGRGGRGGGGGGPALSVTRATIVSKKFTVDRDDAYQVAIELETRGSFDFHPGRCNVICRVDGKEMFTEAIVWSERKSDKYELNVQWTAGEHVVSFEIVPLEALPSIAKPVRPEDPPDVLVVLPPAAGAAPNAAVVAGATPATPEGTPAVPVPVVGEVAAPAVPAALIRPRSNTSTRLDVAIVSVKVRGPFQKEFWIAPENHERFFTDGPAPEEAAARDVYAAKILRQFATRAFRRPVEDKKVDQLVQVARSHYTQPDKTFEEGVGRAMMAVLASPRFLFRVEEPEAKLSKQTFAPIDEYALASRLSYFLWSTMPDAELFGLAERGELRSQLPAQLKRMLADPKTNQGFVRNFTGQWLQARDIEFVPINARAVLGITARGRAGADNAPRVDFGAPLRKAMRSETEMYFEHILRENRSVLELIESDYTFLNSALAGHYGLPAVSGEELRLVKLPPDSVRGGILTQGTFLAVTSNPTRTSPVKRGLFILENILGTPPPPAPPDVPTLEESQQKADGTPLTLREALEMHRQNALCSSCHQRMDPLGLAFENFNAMGSWRDTELKQPINAAGRLATGESFNSVRELKHILVTDRRMDFYRCLTETMLTYALGRELAPHDTLAVDTIVARLVREEGRMSALVEGIIDSVPFQKQRVQVSSPATASLSHPATLAKTEPQP